MPEPIKTAIKIKVELDYELEKEKCCWKKYTVCSQGFLKKNPYCLQTDTFPGKL